MNDSYRKLLHLEFRWKWIRRQAWFYEVRDLTVSLVSPSFIRRISLAASRFLSRLQSSFRDTNPLRSSFSTYCNKHTRVSVTVSDGQRAPKKREKKVSVSYMSVLGVIEEIQRVATQTGPQPPGCLPQTETSIGWCDNSTAVFSRGKGFPPAPPPPFIAPTFPVPRDGQKCGTAAVILWTGIMAATCTWARLTLHD